MRFRFNWKDGTNEEVEMSDCASVEEAVNSRCGSNVEGLESCTALTDAVAAPVETAPKEEAPKESTGEVQ